VVRFAAAPGTRESSQPLWLPDESLAAPARRRACTSRVSKSPQLQRCRPRSTIRSRQEAPLPILRACVSPILCSLAQSRPIRRLRSRSGGRSSRKRTSKRMNRLPAWEGRDENLGRNPARRFRIAPVRRIAATALANVARAQTPDSISCQLGRRNSEPPHNLAGQNQSILLCSASGCC
jgi:hypothetical protein